VDDPVAQGVASPVLREDYARRAGTAAAYREARGITDPEQAVSFGPHPGPELEALRIDTFRALEITDEHAEIRAMSRGELEAQVLDGDRAQATAPRDTSSQLRMTAQAQADAWQQAAEIRVPRMLGVLSAGRIINPHLARPDAVLMSCPGSLAGGSPISRDTSSS
jgi:hypothetical protein